LRDLLRRKGVVVQPAVLLLCLESKVAMTVPAAVENSVRAACAAGTAPVASNLIAKGVLSKMFWLKMQTAGIAAAIVIVTAATGAVVVNNLQAGEPKADPPVAAANPAQPQAQAPLKIKEGVITLPQVPHPQPIQSVEWVDSGRAVLVVSALESVFED